jgi:putative endopeptidase
MKMTPKNILECEKAIIKCFDNTLEEITISESHKLGFDWVQFTKLMGFSAPIYIGSKKYILDIMKVLKDWNTPKWHNYWYYCCMKQMIKFSIKFSVNKYPDNLRGFRGLTMCFNTFLSKKYAENFNKMDILYVKKMAHNLQNTFMGVISENKWLSNKTEALKKIKYLQITIGTIDYLTPDPDLEYTDDVWLNLKKQHMYYFSKLITYTNKPFIIDDRSVNWQTYPPSLTGNQNYMVNSFYLPSQNTIFIPLGLMYLYVPNSLEYNLAGLGYIIAHEMSHTLDDLGSQYDYKGNYKIWWSQSDKTYFSNYIKDIIQEYQVFAKRDGIIWDASNTVSEDIADISGLYILERYLRALGLNYKLFFSYFTKHQHRGNLKGQHPLNKYRIKCSLARNKLFQEVYNIQPNNKMYWPINN